MERERNVDDNADERSATRDPSSHHVPGAGITNRPDEEEKENQDRLPPRGAEKMAD